jgi:hypothetical protein
MNIVETLLAFGEWLDDRGECYNANHPGDVEETHEEVAKAFIEWWNSDPNRAPLAGESREPSLGLASTEQLIKELSARVTFARSAGEDWIHYRTVDA